MIDPMYIYNLYVSSKQMLRIILAIGIGATYYMKGNNMLIYGMGNRQKLLTGGMP